VKTKGTISRNESTDLRQKSSKLLGYSFNVNSERSEFLVIANKMKKKGVSPPGFEKPDILKKPINRVDLQRKVG
jgi:hypothetical protein